MGRPNKIRQANQEAAVRKLAAKGLGFREIAAELQKRGVNVSHMAVARFIQEETQERRDVARSVVAQEAKDTVPLATRALTRIVEMGMNIATRAYLGKDKGGTQQEPKPDAREWATAAKVTAGAARALYQVTMGETPADSLAALRNEAQELLAAKRRREREEEEEAEEAALH